MTSDARPAGLARKLSRYRAGSESAALMEAFLLDQLPAVEGSRQLVVHQIGEAFYQCRRGQDSNGLSAVVCYRRKSRDDALRLSYRRDKARYPRSPRSGVLILPLPVFFATLRGCTNTRLSPEEFSHWSRLLEEAAGVRDPDPLVEVLAAEVDARYPLPALPFWMDPEADRQWAVFEATLRRRLYGRHRQMLVDVHVLLATRWQESMRRTRSGLPCCIEASDSYIAKGLNPQVTERCLDSERQRVKRALDDLQRLGFVRAALFIPSDDPSQRGHYAYLPGEGSPPKDGKVRRPNITPRETLQYLREFKASAELRRTEVLARRTLQEQKQPKGLNEVSIDTQVSKGDSFNTYGCFVAPAGAPDATATERHRRLLQLLREIDRATRYLASLPRTPATHAMADALQRDIAAMEAERERLEEQVIAERMARGRGG